jgi:hypothetical protein
MGQSAPCKRDFSHVPSKLGPLDVRWINAADCERTRVRAMESDTMAGHCSAIV